jgi:predicted DNA-binding protein YlxM (UPF0122 family)
MTTEPGLMALMINALQAAGFSADEIAVAFKISRSTVYNNSKNGATPKLTVMREALEKLDELATKSIKDPISGKALWSWDVRDIARAALFKQGEEK